MASESVEAEVAGWEAIRGWPETAEGVGGGATSVLGMVWGKERGDGCVWSWEAWGGQVTGMPVTAGPQTTGAAPATWRDREMDRKTTRIRMLSGEQGAKALRKYHWVLQVKGECSGPRAAAHVHDPTNGPTISSITSCIRRLLNT